MPERHLDDNGFVIPTPNPDTHQARTQAITNCGLCDQDGYRGTTVCDHTDHHPAAQRGIALIRAQMGWTNQPHTSNPEETA